MTSDFQPRKPLSVKSILIFLSFIALAFGGYALGKGQTNSGEGAMAASSAPNAVAVDVYALKSQTIPMYKDFSGRVRAFKTSEVRPQVDGVILKRLFEEGSMVEKGDALYQIDPAPYEAAYAQATANLKRAEALEISVRSKAERYEKLMDIDAVSAQEYDDAVAALESALADIAVAKAAVKVAKVDLDYTRVYAPIRGVIGQSGVTEGALVQKNQPENLAVISQMDTVYVDMVASWQDALEVKSQLMAQVPLKVELFIGTDEKAYEVTGHVESSSVVVDETTDTVQIRALFKNINQALLPGMFVRARISFPDEVGVLVPQRAAQRSPDGTLSVWKINAQNKIEVQPIQVSRTYEDKWVTTEGVKQGDLIVLKGFQKAGPGAVVSYQDPARADQAQEVAQ